MSASALSWRRQLPARSVDGGGLARRRASAKPMQAPESHRYRIVFGEHGDLRFVGHLDVYRAWERTFRRAGIDLAYSGGYNPRPRLNIGLALPLGCTSAADLIDVWLIEPIDPEQMVDRLQAATPPGLRIVQAQALDPQQPKLQRLIRAAEFEVQLPDEAIDAVRARVERLLSAAELPRQRRGKSYDLRPLIEALALRPDGVLWMRLAARSGAVGRADEVLRALDLAPESLVPCRTRLVLEAGPG